MTEKQHQEHFPELSVMDFKVLCNIAFHGEIPSSYALRNIASRANVNDVNEALSHLKKHHTWMGLRLHLAIEEDKSALLNVLNDVELSRLIDLWRTNDYHTHISSGTFLLSVVHSR